nr:MAG TPA: hypothetical protein [Caudoviricetes sp.]
MPGITIILNADGGAGPFRFRGRAYRTGCVPRIRSGTAGWGRRGSSRP